MTKLAMPRIDRKLLSKKETIFANLKKIINAENVLAHEDQVRPYETDALSAYKQKPLAVVFPQNTKEVSKILVGNNIATRNDNFYAWRCLKALGIDTNDGVVRLSMTHYNSKEDIHRLINALEKV